MNLGSAAAGNNAMKQQQAVVYPPSDLGDVAGGQRMTSEQEKLLLEHLPIVRFLARRIHERLPQHVELDDLSRPAWWD